MGPVWKGSDLARYDDTATGLQRFCRLASASGDCGSDIRTSRPIAPAPELLRFLVNRLNSSRDQGQRPYCRRLSSSIRTRTTAERCAGCGASRKNVSVRRISESRITGMSEKATKTRTNRDSANRFAQILRDYAHFHSLYDYRTGYWLIHEW